MAERDWFRQLADLVGEPPECRVVIIGVGHPLRGDDYVGSLVARDLKKTRHDGRVLVVDAEHSPENFVRNIELFQPSLVLFVDSLDAQLAPGSITMASLDQTSYPFFSTHGLPLRIIVQAMPSKPRAFVLGIQPTSSNFGEQLSAEVSSARTHVVRELRRIFAERRGNGTS